jgi:Flp pilus assembly pilin Flp
LESLVRGVKIGADSGDSLTVSLRSSARSALHVFGGREDGQTMAEYAVVLGMITVAIVGVFTALSGGVSSALEAVRGVI